MANHWTILASDKFVPINGAVQHGDQRSDNDASVLLSGSILALSLIGGTPTGIITQGRVMTRGEMGRLRR